MAPDAPLLSPLGPVRENGMPRWFRRLGEGVFDEDDLRPRATELAAFLPQAARAHGLPGRFVAIGFSNGANMAAALLLLHPGALAGAVLLRAMEPLVPQRLPALPATSVLVAAGRRDPLIPSLQAQRLADLLRRCGAEVTLRYSDAGHALAREEAVEAAAWLAARSGAMARA